MQSLLGEGAFGAVFEIEREDFGIKYSSALKIVSIPQSESELEYIKDEGMDEDATSKYYEDILMRMMNEFALMSKMRGHSNIVSYEDHQIIPHEGSIGWDILIRMELLTPIRKWQENHLMTEKDVIELGIDICDALEVCKKYNIIHRDIKPENIFVSSSDNYKLGDFGIARTMENTRGASTKAGTGRYMAPEVYRGERYNDTVDIYSLGLVLYRYLNDNRAPFLPPYPQPIKFSDQEMAQEKRLNGERLPKATHASDGIMDVINKACQFKPNDRYHSASEMKKDLLSLQSTIGVTAETVNNNDNTSSESNICEVKNTEKSARESKDAENNSIIRDNESIEVRKEDTYEKESEPVSLPIEDENDLTEVVSNEEKTVGYFTDVPTKNNLNDEKSDKAKSKKLQIVLATIFLLVAMFFAYTRLFGMGFVADKNALLPETDLIDQIAVGDVISFGSYKGNPISWYVVDKKDGEAMLLCVNALEECRYHNSRKDIVWNESDIRQWLNGEFYNESFDDEEKTRIKTYGPMSRFSTN